VRAAVYKPKNGEPQVECAVKCLKTDNHGTNERVSLLRSLIMIHVCCYSPLCIFSLRSCVKQMLWPA
jgi:hypothetical protein